ncbi:MAG: aldo/keto reductase [Dysgonamonadaceae bacterium]|jgi:predicted aldo/keto reductase-like oxidoreductase|nr:aldo/keto reductase [Dysgonamonadaceae bacterium]
MTNLNRRNFLRISATAGAGALFLHPAESMALVKKGNDTKFPTRKLGKTDLELPILSMGVMRADNPSVLRAAYNAGIIHFDTANGYQNGKNEEMVGNVLKGKPRESFVVATKCKANYPYGDNFEKEFTERFETSLKRLQMDYVDIFYAHALGEVGEVDDPRLVALLSKFKKEGKTRYLGFSTHANKPKQIDAAIDAGIYDVILLSYNFKMKQLKETDEAIARGVKAGIGFVAMKTMTGGVADAEGKKKIDAGACLKWAWQNKNITTIIPGFSSYDELEQCIAAANSPDLSNKEKEYLAALCNEELLYCVNCGKCVADCVEHLPIPDMMRAYMYNYGYKQPALSKDTLMELALSDDMCTSCKSCAVSCTEGFNVQKKIASISGLINVPNEFLV